VAILKHNQVMGHTGPADVFGAMMQRLNDLEPPWPAHNRTHKTPLPENLDDLQADRGTEPIPYWALLTQDRSPRLADSPALLRPGTSTGGEGNLVEA